MKLDFKDCAVFAETQPFEEGYLQAQAGEETTVRYDRRTAQEIAAEMKDTVILSVFIKSKVDETLLKTLPHLRLVTTRSTGYDHIDLKACQSRGIAVANVPVYGENTVAEHTFALILSLSRNLRKAYLRTLQNDFRLDGLMGFDLKGKTLGIIGTGHIGLHVIRMALGFGMKVAAFDVKEQTFLAEVMGFHYAPLESVLGQADILSLHVPYLPETRHIINSKTIQFIKRGALLINTARGGLVDTDALVAALNEKILSGAGLDVLEEEEYLLEEKRLLQNGNEEAHWQKLQTTLKNHVLLHRENVIYTPHMAFYSREAVERILDTTLENMQAFLMGKPLNRIV